ncbi:MAG: ATP-binding protein [Bacteroidia bacterium]
METLELSKSIQINSKTENITLVEKLIDEVCEEHKVNEDYYGNILIAITEAVNNAILHGNKNNPDKLVKIHVETVSNKHLSFKISDQGKGFDYDGLPDPTDPENLEKPNGRGVFLMKNLADEVKFFDNGTTVELKFTAHAN